MRTGLTISSVWEDSSLLEVRVTATNVLFQGTAHIYINPGQLSEAGKLLRGFPTNRSDVREIQWGDLSENGACGGVNLKFSCKDPKGHSQVEVRIASDLRFGPVDSAHLFIPIEPAAVDEFIRDLDRLVGDRTHTACLTSPSLATSY